MGRYRIRIWLQVERSFFLDREIDVVQSVGNKGPMGEHITTMNGRLRSAERAIVDFL